MMNPTTCSTRLEPSRLAVVVALVLLWVSSAGASTPAVLVDLDLRPHAVTIQRVAEGVISYFDADRRLRVEPADRFVQVRQIGSGSADAAAVDTDPVAEDGGADALGAVELIDGQRLTGRWVGADASGQDLVWRHPLLGRVVLSLDQILRLVPSAAGAEPLGSGPPRLNDQVVLANGDTLDGFVSGIDPAGLVFVRQGHDQELVLPIDRVRAVSMANASKRHRPNRCVVWLYDGSRLDTRSIGITADRVLVEPLLITSAPPQKVSVEQVVRIDLPVADGYLVDLVDLPMAVTAGGEVLGVPLPPRVEGRVVRMHAPVTVRYDLPDQAQRFSATAQVVGGREPSAAQAWADFRIVVGTGGRSMPPSPLNTTQRTVAINTELLGRRLSIELSEADNGPIMDRMLLRDALVLVRRSSVSPAR